MAPAATRPSRRTLALSKQRTEAEAEVEEAAAAAGAKGAEADLPSAEEANAGGESYEGTRWHADILKEWEKSGRLPKFWDAVSGTASGSEATKPLTDWLMVWMKLHAVHSMVEASAGHWPSGWQRNVTWPHLDYTGVDVQPEVVAADQRLAATKGSFGLKSMKFQVWDMLKAPLPAADLLFVKDTLIHFPNDAIQKFLDLSVNVCPRRFKYVLFVHPAGPHHRSKEAPENNGELHPVKVCGLKKLFVCDEIDNTTHVYGGARSVDMANAPFNLPVETLLEYQPENHKVQLLQPPDC